MDLATFLTEVSADDIAKLCLAILGLVEISPIKISPLKWLGNKLNADVKKKQDEIEAKLTKVEGKLDEHVAQSYRNKILSFQNECLNGTKHTKEEFDEVIDACNLYEVYVRDNKLKNDKCELAICYIKRVYQKCQDERTFAQYV